MGPPLGEAGPGLRGPERKQNRGTLIALRRPAAPYGGSGRRFREPRSGSPCEPLEQAIDAPRIGRGLAREQVLGDTLLRARLLGEQYGGVTVTPRAFRARELRIETALDDRMNERHRTAGLDDPGVDEELSGFGGLARVEARKPRCLMKLALLEDRERPREPPSWLRQPTKP